MITKKEHKIEMHPMKEKVEVFMDGERVAETTNAIKLFEAGHDPVIYIPKKDIKNLDLKKFGDYRCPFKGEAELYNINHGTHRYENVAWAYEHPFAQFDVLKDRLAFYPKKVQEIRVTG